ncbi:hypothetical protein C8F01DRAFT_275659 [Mycena amicta]|nr:hypothetical protein C8F01DRAFT_275659 [Mycena amicta]
MRRRRRMSTTSTIVWSSVIPFLNSWIWSINPLWLVHRGRGTLGSKIAVRQSRLARNVRTPCWLSVVGEVSQWIMALAMAPRKQGAFAMVIMGPHRRNHVAGDPPSSSSLAHLERVLLGSKAMSCTT